MNRHLRLLLFALPLLLVSSIAFAQSPTPPADPSSLLGQLLGFITTGHGIAAVGVGLTLIVWEIQKYTADDSFWLTTLGENVLAHGFPALLYLGGALASGSSLSIQLFIAAIAAGFAVKGVVAHLRSMSKPKAGGGAAAAVAKTAIVVAIVLSASGCKGECAAPQNANSVSCKLVGAVVDCTGVSSVGTAVTVVEPIVQNLLAGAVQSDGSVSWSSIEPKLLELAWQYGMCVVAQVWDDLLGGDSSGSGSGAKLTASRANAVDLKAGFEHLRVKLSPGKSFKLTSGRTL